MCDFRYIYTYTHSTQMSRETCIYVLYHCATSVISTQIHILPKCRPNGGENVYLGFVSLRDDRYTFAFPQIVGICLLSVMYCYEENKVLTPDSFQRLYLMRSPLNTCSMFARVPRTWVPRTSALRIYTHTTIYIQPARALLRCSDEFYC